MDLDGIELLWIPLGAGAGGAVVRASGRIYEATAAARGHRPRRDLFHSALQVRVGGVTTVVEMAPAWAQRGERGVVAEGPVGARALGRWRAFRYEVRRWPGGSIPDAAFAIGGPVRISRDGADGHRLLGLVPGFPIRTWGRDELGTGDMWNSNSLVSWLLYRAGLGTSGLAPPGGGRAPGWDAGLEVAARPAEAPWG